MNSDSEKSVPISEVMKKAAKLHPKAVALRRALYPIVRVHEDLKTCEDLPSLFAILEGSKFLDVMGTAVETAGKLMDEVRPRRPKKIGPNARCPCNSGKKFKRCCGKAGAKQRAVARRRTAFNEEMKRRAKESQPKPQEPGGSEGETPKG